MARTAAPSDPKYDPHFAAAGRLVETWAQLEFRIDQAIWELAGVEQMFGACITAQLIGVNGRLRALRALVRLRGGSDALIRELGTFAGSLSRLQHERHRVAHDPRMIHKETGAMERLEITADNSLTFGFQPESPDTLLATRNEIAAKVREFIALFERTRRELSSLPEKSRPQLRRIVPVKRAGEYPASETPGTPPQPEPSEP